MPESTFLRKSWHLDSVFTENVLSVSAEGLDPIRSVNCCLFGISKNVKHAFMCTVPDASLGL